MDSTYDQVATVTGTVDGQTHANATATDHRMGYGSYVTIRDYGPRS